MCNLSNNFVEVGEGRKKLYTVFGKKGIKFDTDLMQQTIINLAANSKIGSKNNETKQHTTGPVHFILLGHVKKHVARLLEAKP